MVEISTGLQQLAASQQLPDTMLMTALSDRLAVHFADPRADAGLLAEALGCLASLGYQPSLAYLGNMSEYISEKLPEFSATDLSRYHCQLLPCLATLERPSRACSNSKGSQLSKTRPECILLGHRIVKLLWLHHTGCAWS